MGFHYKIEEGRANFVTLTVVDWIDVFTRENHKMAIVESHEYLFSSAKNYAGLDGLLDVEVIPAIAF